MAADPVVYSEYVGDAPAPADALAAVDAGLGAANDAAAPLHEVRPLACLVRDGDGRVVGGAVGRTWGACAELQQLWVAPERQHAGIGTELVRRFEGGAAARGCRLVYLTTWSFQAPRFYAALGYGVARTVSGFGPGLARHEMQRELAAPGVGSPAAPDGPPTARPTNAASADVTICAITTADVAGDSAAQLAGGLAALLQDAVAGGASVGFVDGLSAAEAGAWARSSLQAIGPERAVWVARSRSGQVVGSVQLAPVLKPNGRHRGEVMKLLVHRTARGRGISGQLMAALEAHARGLGLSILGLDTEAGSTAEQVYLHWGWLPFGCMPDHSVSPNGTLHATAYLYKRLG